MRRLVQVARQDAQHAQLHLADVVGEPRRRGADARNAATPQKRISTNRMVLANWLGPMLQRISYTLSNACEKGSIQSGLSSAAK